MFFKKHPLWAVIAGFIAFAVLLQGSAELVRAGISLPGYWQDVLVRVVIFAVLLLILLPVSGKRSLRYRKGDVGAAVKLSLWVLIPAVLYAVINVILAVKNGAPAGWSGKFIQILLLCALVGLVEELYFRVIVNDSILGEFKAKKGVFRAIAIVSFFLFGFVHVSASLKDAFASLPAASSCVMKFLQSGVFALFALRLFWDRRSFWGIAVVHALNDLLLMLPDAFAAEKTTLEVSYVQTTGYESLAVYALSILFVLIALLRLRKKGIGRNPRLTFADEFSEGE